MVNVYRVHLDKQAQIKDHVIFIKGGKVKFLSYTIIFHHLRKFTSPYHPNNV